MRSASPLLECHAVEKRFGDLVAVAGVSLQLQKGEILGMVGPNGSGKSTLINCISGYYRPDGGEILIRGERIDELPAHEIAQLGLARSYQIPRPFSTLTVFENVKAGCYFGRRTDPAKIEEEARRWLAFAGLENEAHKPVDSLTLHQRKFLELARALACRPEVLMLDEVLAGLNPSEMDVAIGLIRRVHEMGVSVLLVEHIMHAVVSLCDRVVCLASGQVLAEGPPDQCLRDEKVVTAYLGRSHA